MKRTSNWIKAPVVLFIRAPLMASFIALVILGQLAHLISDWLSDHLPGFD